MQRAEMPDHASFGRNAPDGENLTASSGAGPAPGERSETGNVIDPAEDALFLDFDGTLVDIAAMPDAVDIPPGLPARLMRLQDALGGALALLSGRPVETLDRYLAPLRPIAAGIHGAEIRTVPHGPVARLAPPLSPAILAAVQQVVEREAGALMEWKGLSVAVHYRANPEAAGRIETELQRIMAAHGGGELQRGRNVCEVLPAPVSKGAALEAIMTLPVFRGRRPVMIGDDLTDLPAFAAAERLGGLALKVAGGPFTVDEAAFLSPAAVRAWIGETIARLP